MVTITLLAYTLLTLVPVRMEWYWSESGPASMQTLDVYVTFDCVRGTK